MKEQPLQVNYASHTIAAPPKHAGLLSLSFAGVALMLELMLWNGVFASDLPLIPLAVTALTIGLIVASLIIAANGLGKRAPGSIPGMLLSVSSLIIFLILTVYFLRHLAIS